jgi:hypothetical protein
MSVYRKGGIARQRSADAATRRAAGNFAALVNGQAYTTRSPFYFITPTDDMDRAAISIGVDGIYGNYAASEGAASNYCLIGNDYLTFHAAGDEAPIPGVSVGRLYGQVGWGFRGHSFIINPIEDCRIEDIPQGELDYNSAIYQRAGNLIIRPSNGHYVRIQGTLRYGAWRDELGELLGKKRKGVRISDDLDEGVVLFSNACALADDWIITNVQFNHDRALGGFIHPHLHWSQSSAAVPNWMIEYRWQRNGEAKVTSWTRVKCTSQVFTYTSGTIQQIASWDEIEPPEDSGLSDILQVRIIRDCANASGLFAGADPLAGNAAAVMFDVHIAVDGPGSAEEYVK